MNFTIDYDNQPKKFLKKLDKQNAFRLITKIEVTLTTNPVPHDAKTIVGEHGVFRIRVGNFRVLYRINYENNCIIVIKIDNRERVYQ